MQLNITFDPFNTEDRARAKQVLWWAEWADTIRNHSKSKDVFAVIDKSGTCTKADLSALGLERHAWSMRDAGLIHYTHNSSSRSDSIFSRVRDYVL